MNINQGWTNVFTRRDFKISQGGLRTRRESNNVESGLKQALILIENYINI